jgi:nucleoside-diphosphate-sugar epimerase
MRILVLGGTRFIGRHVVERLHARGDDVALVHRGASEPADWVRVRHFHADRKDLRSLASDIRTFRPDAIVDSFALTAGDVDAARELPDVPTVVLSSQDVYQAFAALRSGMWEAPVPLREDSELRRVRHPYRGSGYEGVPEDYEKLDVEERWLARRAVVLRLPMVYGPHDEQLREDPILQRVRAGRLRIPVGGGTLLWTRGHVDDVASAVLAAIDTRAADGKALNIGESAVYPIVAWYQQILDSADSPAELVQVPDAAVPVDFLLSKTHHQHILASVQRAMDLLQWRPGDPVRRVEESVLWHLRHPSPSGWSVEKQLSDEAALAKAIG